jgi:hypothetical protein
MVLKLTDAEEFRSQWQLVGRTIGAAVAAAGRSLSIQDAIDRTHHGSQTLWAFDHDAPAG